MIFFFLSFFEDLLIYLIGLHVLRVLFSVVLFIEYQVKAFFAVVPSFSSRSTFDIQICCTIFFIRDSFLGKGFTAL